MRSASKPILQLQWPSTVRFHRQASRFVRPCTTTSWRVQAFRYTTWKFGVASRGRRNRSRQLNHNQHRGLQPRRRCISWLCISSQGCPFGTAGASVLELIQMTRRGRTRWAFDRQMCVDFTTVCSTFLEGRTLPVVYLSSCDYR